MPVVKTDYDVQLFRPLVQGQLPSNLKIIDASSPAITRNRNSNLTSNQSLRKKQPYVKNDGTKYSPVTRGGFGKVIFRTTLLILLYYVSSIGLTFYQKWLLKTLHYPLSIVISHLVVKFILALCCRIAWEWWTQQKRPVLNWKVYSIQLAPAGVASALDIGLSNWSFEYITVSLYTMTKSTAIIFIMGFALLFKLEKKHWTLLVVVVMISGGLIMFTYQATQFNLAGFIMVMSASFLSGLRWTLSQMVMQKSEIGLTNPVDMMYHIQPWMIFTLLPFAFSFEGFSLATTKDFILFDNVDHLLSVLGRIMLGAIIAFFMELAEYLLVSYTSSLTLSVSGIVKEVLTLTLAIMINHDELSSINKVGLVTCILGITLHVILKALRMHSESKGGHINPSVRSSVVEEQLLMDSFGAEDNDEDIGNDL